MLVQYLAACIYHFEAYIFLMIGFLWNQIFKIQSGGFQMMAAEMKNRDNIGESRYSEVFGVADDKPVIRFSKFKIADSRWCPPKWKSMTILVKIYIRGFLATQIMNPLSDY